MNQIILQIMNGKDNEEREENDEISDRCKLRIPADVYLTGQKRMGKET